VGLTENRQIKIQEHCAAFFEYAKTYQSYTSLSCLVLALNSNKSRTAEDYRFNPGHKASKAIPNNPGEFEWVCPSR